MSRYNTSKMMSTYTDDFGNTYDNVPFKIQLNAPSLGLYADREAGFCAASNLFTTRRLIATFADGRKLIYPVPNEDQVVPFATALRGAGAICLDYEGEKWNLLVPSVVGGALNYTGTPYTDLTARKTYNSGSFDYTSALGLTGFTTFSLPVRIPDDGSADLLAAQTACLTAFDVNQGICAAGGIIEPRMLIIKASAIDAGSTVRKSVVRQAKVSSKGNLGACAISIADAASCLGYIGESVNGIHNLLG